MRSSKDRVQFFSGRVAMRRWGSDGGEALCIGYSPVAGVLSDFRGRSVYSVVAFSDHYISARRMLDLQIRSAEGLLPEIVTSTGPVEGEIYDYYSELTGHLGTSESGSIGGHDIVRIVNIHTGVFAAWIISLDPINWVDITSTF